MNKTVNIMTIEEKAKRYDETIERAKKVKDNPFAGYDGSDVISYLFPELKESEDERTRKALIDYFDDANKADENPLQVYGIHTDKAIAWLEKQGEQKPAWSEEDERKLQLLIAMCDDTKGDSVTYSTMYREMEELKTWLKVLKNRVQPQNLTVTDEELAQAKKDAYNDALDKLEYNSGNPTFDDGWSAAIWYLKKRNVQFKNA